MKNMKKVAKTVGTLGLVGCAVMSSPYAVAADDSGWIAGLNVGQSRAKIDDGRITSSLSGVGLGTTSMSNNNNDYGYKLFGGYQFNKNFALEAGFFDLGQFGYTATTSPLGTLSGNIRLKGVNLDLVGILPLADKFSVFGRLGMQYAQAKDNFTTSGAVAALTNPNPNKNALNYKFGVGAQYDFTKSVGLRVEAESYRINDAINNFGNIDMYSVGLVFKTGEEKAPAPVEKVLMPKPEIVVVHTPAPPAPPAEIIVVSKVVFSADSDANALFTFGKSTLKPTGKRALDKFAAELKGAHFKVIKIVGYTDRIGSSDSNMALSRERAEAVKDYLVASAGIPADKISATGAGESNPLTKPSECKGNIATQKLKACLAPDRRVEVDVTGTRPAK